MLSIANHQVAEEECIRKFPVQGNPFGVVISGDRMFCYHDDDPVITMIDLDVRKIFHFTFSNLIQSGETVGTLKGHKSAVTCIASLKDAIFSGSRDRSIMEWKIQ